MYDGAQCRLLGPISDIRRAATPKEILCDLDARRVDGTMESWRKAIGWQIGGIHSCVEQPSDALDITR